MEAQDEDNMKIKTFRLYNVNHCNYGPLSLIYYFQRLFKLECLEIILNLSHIIFYS